MNWQAPSEVVDIESDDTDGFRHEELADIALSPNNMHPDLEIIEVNTVKVVHSHSNFGPHPDDLGFHHYMPPPKKAKDFYEAYEKGLVGLSSYQFIHKVPYEIKFTGNILWNQLMRGGSFDINMCNAIMRLFKSLDDQIYQPGFDRWRHLLPATFAEKVLNGDYYIGDNLIYSAFVGNHINYNIEDCSMLFVMGDAAATFGTLSIREFKFWTH